MGPGRAGFASWKRYLPACNQMERFKPTPESVLAPDPRSRHSPDPDWAAGIQVPESLRKYHEEVALLALEEYVPERIQSAFNASRNLYVYGWFFYPFCTMAEFYAYVCLEMALGERWRSETGAEKHRDPPSLDRLMRMAVKKSWIQDEGIRHVERLRSRQDSPSELMEALGLEPAPKKRRPDYVETLAKITPTLRNAMAHQFMFWWSKTLTLEIVCDLVNQLFAPRSGAHAGR